MVVPFHVCVQIVGPAHRLLYVTTNTPGIQLGVFDEPGGRPGAISEAKLRLPGIVPDRYADPAMKST
jgi:hypothetical protein